MSTTTDGGGIGFTGVEWEMRPPDGLAHALTAGPGPGQAGELAAVWASAAAELESVASEYRRLAVELSADWVSAASPGLDDRSRRVADDVHGLSTRARELADRAAGHSRDHAIARAAMPKAAETAATTGALEALDSLGPGLAGLLSGATDALENLRSDQRRAAARVMAEYETRTAPLAVPVERPAPPRRLVTGIDTGVGGDSTVAAASTPTTPASAGTGGPSPSLSSALPGAAAAPPAPAGVQVRPATAGAQTTAPSPAPGAASAPEPRADRAGSAAPMAPMGPMGAAGAAGGGDDDHRAADTVSPTGTEVEDLYGLSVAVAPPVFGGGATATPEPTAAEFATSEPAPAEGGAS